LNFPQNSEELADVLKKIYAEARRADGAPYTKNSLCSIRFCLKRYFKAVNNINIINGKEFDEVNSVYKAQCTALKKNGLSKTEHKPAIADEDITKLYESGIFNTETPATLQNKICFEIMFYFCRRGRQNLREYRDNDMWSKQKTNSQKTTG
jgi:hypothetical protein